LYLERNFNANITTPKSEEIEVIENDEIIEQEEQLEPQQESLYAMTEYTFKTKDAYFSAIPRVDIIQKTKTSIKFSIPFGIDNVTIKTYDELGQEITKTYNVVVV
jgi:hypothetical protein